MGSLPEKIIVAFKNDSSCFNGMLAGIGELLKNGKSKHKFLYGAWPDKSIPMQTFDNVFTEGFVLNTSAGGRTGRDFREVKIRVYDPRGIEFEITTNNLLEILGCCNSTKGKALEGRFCYFWNGLGGVYLLSENSTLYKDHIKKQTEIKTSQVINKSELIDGATYEDIEGNKKTYYKAQEGYIKKIITYKEDDVIEMLVDLKTDGSWFDKYSGHSSKFKPVVMVDGELERYYPLKKVEVKERIRLIGLGSSFRLSEKFDFDLRCLSSTYKDDDYSSKPLFYESDSIVPKEIGWLFDKLFKTSSDSFAFSISKKVGVKERIEYYFIIDNKTYLAKFDKKGYLITLTRVSNYFNLVEHANRNERGGLRTSVVNIVKALGSRYNFKTLHYLNLEIIK